MDIRGELISHHNFLILEFHIRFIQKFVLVRYFEENNLILYSNLLLTNPWTTVQQWPVPGEAPLAPTNNFENKCLLESSINRFPIAQIRFSSLLQSLLSNHWNIIRPIAIIKSNFNREINDTNAGRHYTENLSFKPEMGSLDQSALRTLHRASPRFSTAHHRYQIRI